MLVRNDDAVEALGPAADGVQPAQQFFLAESGVDKESGALGFEQRAIARTTRGQNGNAEIDFFTPEAPLARAA